MTDWPKMESMVMVSDGYFVSEKFKELYESLQKEMFDEVRGTPVKVVGLSLYVDNSKYCDVMVGERVSFHVPIEYVEYLVADIFDKNIELTPEQAEAIQPVKAGEEKPEIVSFPFTDDSRMEDALLFFARNGYKVWAENEYIRKLYRLEGRLNVEMPKGMTEL